MSGRDEIQIAGRAMIDAVKAVRMVSLMLVIVACQGPASEGPSTGCLEPPEEVLESPTGFGLIPEDDAVASGAVVSLRFELPVNTGDEIMSVSAAWQCWTEQGWQTTHQLFHGSGDVPGERVGPGGAPRALGAGGSTTTEELMGHVVPSVSDVRIPRTAPGIYRIVDEVITGDGTVLTGSAIIQVGDPDGQD